MLFLLNEEFLPKILNATDCTNDFNFYSFPESSMQLLIIIIAVGSVVVLVVIAVAVVCFLRRRKRHKQGFIYFMEGILRDPWILDGVNK